MNPPTGRAQPRRVMQLTTRHEKKLEIWPQGRNPWYFFGRRVRRGLTPPRMPTGTWGGGGQGSDWVPGGDSNRPIFYFIWKIGGKSWRILAAGLGKA